MGNHILKLTCFFYYIDRMKFAGKTQNLNSTPLYLLFSVLLFTILGCTHTEKLAQSCQEIDWYEIGRQNGTKGLELANLKPVRVICKDSDQSLAEALYYNGFDAGVVQYCTPENGFELGRNNREIKNVCPVMLNAAFQKRYYQGRRFAELTRQSQELNKKMQNLETTINNHSIETAKRDLLSTEKIELSLKLKNIQDELQSLNTSIN